MNDLVNMIENVTSVKQNNIKGNSDNTNITKKSTNNSTSFKNTLDKVASREKLQEKVSENKSESVSKEDINDNSKVQKKKVISMDMFLILLMQHMGDKVNLEDALNKLQEEENVEDITGDVLKLIGNSGIDGIDINALNSSKSLQEKVNDIIQALSKNSSDNDDELKEILTKLNQLNNEDLDKDSIEKIFQDVTKSSSDNKDIDMSKTKDIHNQIIDILKSKVLDNKTQNNSSSDSFKTSRDSIETTLQSKITLSNEVSNETKNESSDKNFEEDFLKNLVSDKSKSDSKIDRVTNFMADFNKVNNVKEDIAVEAPVSINKNNIVNDFIKSIKYMEQNNVKEITVKVMPRELGQIVIRLTMENGLMKANITASNKEAYNLLNSKAQELNSTLGNGEIKIQNFAVDIYNGDTTFFSRENSKEQRNNSSNNAKGKNNNSISALEDIKENEEATLDETDSNVNAFV